MDIISSIQWAEKEIEQLPTALRWRESVLAQLRYCMAVVEGKESPERLEQLTMGWIVMRELDGYEPDALQKTIAQISYDLQQLHLPYAAKVRLGIHRRT